MTDYISSIEQIKPATELKFPSNSAFGKYRTLLGHGVSHPAKMSVELCEYLIEHYSEKGSTVIDPFAGAGTTLIVGALLGRNTIGVELEPHFVKFIETAKEKLSVTLGEHGSVEIHQGDSRNLLKIISSADSVITSPPYSSELVDHRKILNSTHLSHPHLDVLKDKYEIAENIANLKHGSIDSVITSPPYAETMSESRHASPNTKSSEWIRNQRRLTEHPESEGQIGSLKLGDISTVITSPPYEDSQVGGGDVEAREKRLIKAGYEPKDFFGGKARNSGLKHYDTAITSPPYEGMNQQDIAKENYGSKVSGGLKRNIPHTQPYSNDFNNQIGNMKRESYLEAVFRVYQETYTLLKEGGVACVVVKPFQRAGKIVDLPLQTWQLLEKCGFQLEEVLKMRLNSLSFWRILQYRKNKDTPQLWHEYALIVRKS